ncbi:MAG: hypothetical protein HY342_05050 [Candidatus Lambdaproteobacteria bacterium]|nr:hypothetical protein [Candidatus Lambdaproteobacteria bacterium]
MPIVAALAALYFLVALAAVAATLLVVLGWLLLRVLDVLRWWETRARSKRAVQSWIERR